MATDPVSPEYSTGDISLIYNGTNVEFNPAVIPYRNLPIKMNIVLDNINGIQLIIVSISVYINEFLLPYLVAK